MSRPPGVQPKIDISNEAPEIGPRPATGGGKKSRTPLRLLFSLAGFGIIILIGFLLHYRWLQTAECPDSDAAIVVLMARHFAHGDFTPYFWGQRYMGALEPLLLTPFNLLRPATAGDAACLALMITIAQALVCVSSVGALRGSPWLTCLVYAVPSSMVGFLHSRLYGARLVASLLCLCAFRLLIARPSRRKAGVAGALFGVALWADHLMIGWASGLWLLLRHRGRQTITTFVLAVLPMLVFDVAAMVAGSGNTSNPREPWHWLSNLALLLHTGLPTLLGVEWVSPLANTPKATAGWVCASALAAVVVMLLGSLVARRGDSQGGEREARPIGALLMVVLSFCLLYVLGAVDYQSTRYLEPALGPLSILLGIAAARLRYTTRPLAVLLVAPAIYSSLAGRSVTKVSDAQQCLVEARQVKESFVRQGVQGAWCFYWDCYRLALLTDEVVPFAPYRGEDRRKSWTEAVLRAEPVAYVVRSDDSEAHRATASALAKPIHRETIGSLELIVMPSSLKEFPHRRGR
ncbi:MAG TPA: hypothetical protein PLW65_06150 [Pseudomonadota bacterium]|nr:hypothetical protein [Pseudomonadota bacterium]